MKNGHDVTLACPADGAQASTVLAAAGKFGLNVITDFHLTKHFSSIRKNLSDIRDLIRYLGTSAPDVLHTHLNNDHFIGGVAARRSEPPVPIIRSIYEGTGPPNNIRNRYLFTRVTDHLILPGITAARRTSDRFAVPASRISVIPPAVNLDRFSPAAPGDLRDELELSKEDFVVLVASRIQRKRRFDLLFKALATLVKNADVEFLRCAIAGRGTYFEQVAVEPVRNLELTDKVVFAGYRKGKDYVRALNTADVYIQLMPGTDGTCRAARQAMALGKPVIAVNAGMAAEIVEHGVNGYIVDKSPASLARMIHSLYLKPDRAKRLGEAARERVLNFNSPERQAEAIDQVYQRVAGKK
jgi:glycosyltransferase involved in cell wall biosynthesis